MIKFFRKIRQKLLSENRFNKYLLYAFGEIILVVIGILIALQINNWNEEKKEKNQVKNILKRVTADFNRNAFEININLKYIRSSSSIMKSIITGNLDVDSLKNNIPYLGKTVSSFSGFEDLKISNDAISLLKTKIQNDYELNNDLMEQLFLLYSETLYEIEVDGIDLTNQFERLYNYNISTLAFYEWEVERDNSKLISLLTNDKTFKNYLNEYRGILLLYGTKVKDFRERGETLMQKINDKYQLENINQIP